MSLFELFENEAGKKKGRIWDGCRVMRFMASWQLKRRGNTHALRLCNHHGL
jgi:hypothetical protein